MSAKYPTVCFSRAFAWVGTRRKIMKVDIAKMAIVTSMRNIDCIGATESNAPLAAGDTPQRTDSVIMRPDCVSSVMCHMIAYCTRAEPKMEIVCPPRKMANFLFQSCSFSIHVPFMASKESC